MTLKITALQIRQWASNREAQASLSALIGRLVAESLPPEAIISKNFPSDVARAGFDGMLITQRNHPYIPEGKSVWEISVETEIAKKANRDFDKRNHQSASDMAFIFVTARNWPRKDKWLAGKQDSKWREVRVYDAIDLEQWLESSPATTLWLSEQIGLPQYHIQSPRAFLKNWLSATDPAFPQNLILQDRDEVKSRILSFTEQFHNNDSLTIFADTSDEALAFICAALDFAISFKAFVITEKQGIEELLPWQRGFEQPHILIIRTSNLASKIPSEITNRNLLLIAEARGAVFFDTASERYQSLPRVSNFNDLEKLYERTHVLEKRTGGSLSALHRQLNRNTAKRTPHWAELSRGNRNFVWLSLIGGWDERHDADKEIICELSEVASFNDWREFTDPLLTGEDAPLFHTREDKPQYKLFSRIDAFLAISQKIRGDEIDRLLKKIRTVYLEDVPNYYSPDNRELRFHEERKYSDALRNGIMDGLAILACYNERGALECSDVTPKIKTLFDEIFADDHAWSKLLDLLPKLAEINPSGFIRKLQETLNNSPKKITDLFPSQGDSIFGPPHLHPPLLWALEGIAWNPNYLDSVLKLLCQLQRAYENRIVSNFMNRPSESMSSILRSWMPKTSANIDQRVKALCSVYKDYPDEGVNLALALAGDDRISNPTHMPIWRDDVLAKQIVTEADYIAIIIKAIDLVMDYLKDERHSHGNRVKIACQTMDNFTWWGTEKAQELVDAIRTIPTNNDTHNRELSDWAREWIRRCSYYSKDDDDRRKFTDMYENLRNYFEPCNLAERYAYLFNNSARVEFEEDNKPEEEIQEMLNEARGEALSKIYEKDGVSGIIDLLKCTETPRFVSACLYANYIAEGNFSDIDKYIGVLLDASLDISVKRDHLSFLFYGMHPSKPMDASDTIAIVEPVLKNITDADKKAALLQTIRIDQREGRDFIDKQSDDVKRQIFSYAWIEKGREIRPQGKVIPPASAWLVDYYLQYKRPRLALASFVPPGHIPPDKQLDLLVAIFVSNLDVGTEKDPMPESYYIGRMLESFASRYADTDDNALAQLAEIEMKLHNLIRYSKYFKSGGFILRRLASSPAYFVDLHRYAGRDEEGNMPDMNIPKVNAEVYARAARDVFRQLNLRHSSCFPWVNEKHALDTEKLRSWIKEVRLLAEEAKMPKIVDLHIGVGLSHSRLSNDDPRPERAVCDIIKNNGSREMYKGFRLGRFNSRGVLTNGRDDMGFTSADLSRIYGIASDKLRDNYPDMAEVFDELSDSYRRDAARWQAEEERRDIGFR